MFACTRKKYAGVGFITKQDKCTTFLFLHGTPKSCYLLVAFLKFDLGQINVSCLT